MDIAQFVYESANVINGEPMTLLEKIRMSDGSDWMVFLNLLGHSRLFVNVAGDLQQDDGKFCLSTTIIKQGFFAGGCVQNVII